ncbi:MAG TPA: ABC transporter permease [candidate division WOR-3 bacterium]|uniref:ABC transporter permease n=1 Tax=candidate division WOR-3 bacterium TaxID=2052148 RepID=A0A9C9K0C0_UNCW3|nr:ABC transporter permease [candidate division WOR-3 bacterium]
MNLFSMIGDFSIFFFRSLFIPWKIRVTKWRILQQIYYIGVGSLPIIVVIATFTGLVSTVQTSYQLIGTVPRYILGVTVGRMVMIELGPILTSLMVSGRCASSMAAEIGTMRVTEQIDALETMAIDPYQFLNLPRIIGTIIALPILTVVCEFIALVSGSFYAHYFLNIPISVFNYGLTHYFYPKDFFGGLVKSLFFALVIATSGCYFGFKVKGGAKEVGKAATYAVVTSSILILILDFLVALVVFG